MLPDIPPEDPFMPPRRRSEPPIDNCEPSEKIGNGGDTTRTPAMELLEAEAADLAAAQAGDHDAFGRLYDRHAAVVLSLCRRLALADAEDATQETFIRAHRKLQHVEDANKLRSWLYAIARRVCSERTRSRRRRTRHEENFAVNRALEPVSASAGEQAPESVARSEDLERLDAALNQLDDRERLALHLYYLETDPVRAAVSALGLSRSGYYKLLARARESLGRIMSATSTS